MFPDTHGSCVSSNEIPNPTENPMNATNENERHDGSYEFDREAFEDVVRTNLSPEGVAAAICFLRTAEFGNRPTTERQRHALAEVEWLANALLQTLGVEEHNRLIDELSL
jgi:hypothetical protein